MSRVCSESLNRCWNCTVRAHLSREQQRRHDPLCRATGLGLVEGDKNVKVAGWIPTLALPFVFCQAGGLRRFDLSISGVALRIEVRPIDLNALPLRESVVEE